jgi:hypothetical protein
VADGPAPAARVVLQPDRVDERRAAARVRSAQRDELARALHDDVGAAVTVRVDAHLHRPVVVDGEAACADRDRGVDVVPDGVREQEVPVFLHAVRERVHARAARGGR